MLELKLSNGKEYKADVKELSVGTIKKLVKAIDVERLVKDSKTEQEFTDGLILSVLGAFSVFEDYLVEVFDGLTIDELEEYGTPSEIAKTLGEVLRYTAFKVSGIGEGLKNLIRAEATT